MTACVLETRATTHARRAPRLERRTANCGSLRLSHPLLRLGPRSAPTRPSDEREESIERYDTEHPHAHVVVRGVCREGQQLRMERAYIARGLRWSAQELATERLGPRLEREIRRTREREVHQERFTSLDREIEHAAHRAPGRCWSRSSRGATVRSRRFWSAGSSSSRALAWPRRSAPSGWVLAENWQRRLRELGERGDILKQMHRALDGGDGGALPCRPPRSGASRWPGRRRGADARRARRPQGSGRRAQADERSTP